MRNPGLEFCLMAVIMIMWGTCCTPSHLTEEELKAYVRDPDHDLVKESNSADYEIKVAFRPTDLLIAQEAGTTAGIDPAELHRLREKYEDYYYFVLSLAKNNKEALYQSGQGYDGFSELVQTLSFRMQQYVNLTTSGRDTIEVGDYIFPRTYGMGGATNLMFAFNKEKAMGKEWLQFNLKEFGLGVGNETFRFKIDDLENVPKIDFTTTSK